MSVYSGPEIPNDGLVLRLDAANTKSYPGSGTTWTDVGGTGINGTFVNTPTYDSLNGGSLSFNGTNASISMSNSSLLHFLNRAPYSFEVLVHPRSNTTNSYPGFIDRESNPGTGRDGYNIYYTKVGIAAGSNLIATERFGTGTVTSIGTTLTDAVFFNNWHYFCTTYDGTTLSFYRNGVSLGSGASTHSITNTVKALTIAVRGGVHSDSKISTVCFYNRALTAAEVQQNFAALRGRYGI